MGMPIDDNDIVVSVTGSAKIIELLKLAMSK